MYVPVSEMIKIQYSEKLSKPVTLKTQTHCYLDLLDTGMNMQHRIVPWADDGFVLYDHYLSSQKHKQNPTIYHQCSKGMIFQEATGITNF